MAALDQTEQRFISADKLSLAERHKVQKLLERERSKGKP